MKNKEMVKCQRIKMAGEIPKNKDGRKVCGACILPASMLEVVFLLPTVLTIWSTRQSSYISDILVLTNIDTKNLISISFFYIWIQVFSWMSTKFLCQSLYAEQSVASFDP